MTEWEGKKRKQRSFSLLSALVIPRCVARTNFQVQGGGPERHRRNYASETGFQGYIYGHGSEQL